MRITDDFKLRVVDALLDQRARFGGTDGAFSKQFGIHQSVFSLLKKKQIEGQILKETKWIELARELDVNPTERKWNMARTEVFESISADVTFCQENAKAMIFVDEPEIGKTHTAKYLSRTLENCFYIDCSQSKSKTAFIRALAKAIGVDNRGTYANMKENIKYYLRMLHKPIVILDEAGDLSYGAFLDIKEFWNATEGVCGWYMMGADGLRTMIDRGINREQVGFREIFSRYSARYMSIVPRDRNERLQFYSKLITDVISVNTDDKSIIPGLVRKCLASDATGTIGGLRRAETLLILEDYAA